VIAAGASVLVGGVLYYTSTQTTLTRRINQYDTSVSAAVAATEKVVANITKDFQTGGATVVGNNVPTYTGLVPKTEDLTSTLLGVVKISNSGPGNNNTVTSSTVDWTKFEFKDALGQLNRTDIQKVSDWTFRDLNAKYPGLHGYAATYRVISNTRQKNRSYQITSAVRQDIEIASIPLCQFQYFYVPDLELHPSSGGMRFNGRVHCNASIYSQPAVEVAFQNHVTASRKILNTKHPADPVVRAPGKVSYRAERETGLNTLNIPIGTNAGPNQLRDLLEAPAGVENPASLMAQERFYNKADLIVVVSNNVVTARSGSYNAGSVAITWLDTRGIVTRSASTFYDQRECRDMAVTDVDMANLVANYADFTKLLGRPLKTVWFLDLGDNGKRAGDGKDKDKDGNPLDNNNGTGNDKNAKGAVGIIGGVVGSTTVPPGVVRLRNASSLPPSGLTVIAPNPIYILGNFNTATPVPALIVGDAVTILSGNWNDINGSKTLASRIAVDTTVNAAILPGIVPTGNGAYSGGAENSLRLLEDWTGRTLTFNGSIAVLYYSKIADAPWGGPEVYKPPTRAWSYDIKLADLANTPPSMPNARTVFRSDWTLIKPNSKL